VQPDDDRHDPHSPGQPGPGKPHDDGDRPDRTPDTPTDEPKPAPVQDPPAEPGRPPLVVLRGGRDGSRHTERTVMNEVAKGRIVNGERKERRGFASMSPEKQREIASKGGRAAHQKGTAHEWTSEEARSAGRKGGQISRGGRGRLVETPVGQTAGEAAPAPDRAEEFTGQS
jgi:general stress protein YciG